MSETTPEAKIAALQKHATKDGVSLLSNVLVQELNKVNKIYYGTPKLSGLQNHPAQLQVKANLFLLVENL